VRIHEFVWAEDIAVEGTMKTPHLPKTDSIQELAHFWDKHDLTDFEDELEEVTEPVFEPARYLVVRQEEEIVPFINQIEQIKEKYSYYDVRLLASRVISAEQIRSDF
jgi:hypothetical protein